MDSPKLVPTVFRFHLSKDYIRRFEFKRKSQAYTLWHIYPTVWDWCAGDLPEEINPRSHADMTQMDKRLVNEIAATVVNAPEDFPLANRGAAVFPLAFHYDQQREIAELVVADNELHGIADGGTSDRVLADVKKRALASLGVQDALAVHPGSVPSYLRDARFHVEVILGEFTRKDILPAVSGRNSSRQVAGVSLADFTGLFDWIKDELSDVQFTVAYEEYASGDINVLDIIGMLTLFHAFYDRPGKRRAPTLAYAAKGSAWKRLDADPQGYEALRPLMKDILSLSETIQVEFARLYKQFNGNLKGIGNRLGISAVEKTLPITNRKTEYIIDKGYLYPLMAALRCCVAYNSDGKAYWKQSPVQFYMKHGGEMIDSLFDIIEQTGAERPTTCGKMPVVYTQLHQDARDILAAELNQATR